MFIHIRNIEPKEVNTIKSLSQLIMTAIALISGFRPKIAELEQKLKERDEELAALKLEVATDNTARQAAEDSAAKAAQERDELRAQFAELDDEAEKLATAIDLHPGVPMGSVQAPEVEEIKPAGEPSSQEVDASTEGASEESPKADENDPL